MEQAVLGFVEGGVDDPTVVGVQLGGEVVAARGIEPARHRLAHCLRFGVVGGVRRIIELIGTHNLGELVHRGVLGQRGHLSIGPGRRLGRRRHLIDRQLPTLERREHHREHAPRPSDPDDLPRPAR